MSYCVNCGVELADNQERCPLCGTAVLNPAEPGRKLSAPPFPSDMLDGTIHRRHRAAFVAIAILLLIPLLTCLVCDIALNEIMTWSRYVVAGFIIIYAFVFPPAFIRRHRVTISIIIDWLALVLFLWMICSFTGGSWFWPFALSVSTVSLGMIYIVYILARHSPWNFLKIGSVVLGASGLFSLYIEWIINRTFFDGKPMLWSFFTMIPCVVLCILLAFVDSNKELKQAIKKRFFI